MMKWFKIILLCLELDPASDLSFLWHVPAPSINPKPPYLQRHSPMAAVSLSRAVPFGNCKSCSKTAQGTVLRAQSTNPACKLPRSHSNSRNPQKSTANVLIPDITRNSQRSRVHALMGLTFSGSTRAVCTVIGRWSNVVADAVKYVKKNSLLRNKLLALIFCCCSHSIQFNPHQKISHLMNATEWLPYTVLFCSIEVGYITVLEWLFISQPVNCFRYVFSKSHCIASWLIVHQNETWRCQPGLWEDVMANLDKRHKDKTISSFSVNSNCQPALFSIKQTTTGCLF